MAKFKSKYSPKERQDFHNNMAKPGAKKFDSSGSIVKVSDFERGVHKAKADQIFKARKKAAIKHNSGK